MVFGADELESLERAAELINTGRARSGQDEIAGLADVVAMAARHKLADLDKAVPGDLRRLRAYRARLDAAASACAAGDTGAAVDVLNALLAETGAVPQIASHDGRSPHIHVSRTDAPLADRMVASMAMGLAELVVAGQSHRVRTCAGPGCREVFVDLTRNQSRRYCSDRTCGNRAHVAAYRARHASAGGTPARDTPARDTPAGVTPTRGTPARVTPSRVTPAG